MRKSILFLVILFSFFAFNLQAAQTDWSNNGIVNMARMNNQQWNNFFTTLNKNYIIFFINVVITIYYC